MTNLCWNAQPTICSIRTFTMLMIFNPLTAWDSNLVWMADLEIHSCEHKHIYMKGQILAHLFVINCHQSTVSSCDKIKTVREIREEIKYMYVCITSRIRCQWGNVKKVTKSSKLECFVSALHVCHTHFYYNIQIMPVAQNAPQTQCTCICFQQWHIHSSFHSGIFFIFAVLGIYWWKTFPVCGWGTCMFNIDTFT